MSIACPYCKAVLNPKALKPGRFQPKCPGCGEAFLLVIEVQPLASKAAPEPVPKKRVLSVEEQASLLLEGKDPGDYGELGTDSEADPNVTVARESAVPAASKPSAPKAKPAPQPAPRPARDPNATGDFTQADDAPPPKPAAKKSAPVPQKAAVREPDANATGDFTQANEPAPKPKKAAPRTEVRAPDANATGDFTTPGPGAEHEAPGEATGEFTKVGANPDSESEADDDDPKPAKKAAGRLKPAHTVKAGEAAAEDDFEDDEVPPRLGGYEVLKHPLQHRERLL